MYNISLKTTLPSTLFTLHYLQVHYKCLLVSYLSIYTISLILEVSIITVSLRGSVIDDKPRRTIRPLIYIKQGLVCGELILLTYSTKVRSRNGNGIFGYFYVAGVLQRDIIAFIFKTFGRVFLVGFGFTNIFWAGWVQLYVTSEPLLAEIGASIYWLLLYAD